MAKQISITDEGKKKLEAELEYLKTEKRREVSEAIKVARGFGDLSENSEYDEAKNEQAKVEAQILELEETLKNLRVISENDIKTDIVNVGARVKVYDKAFMEEVEYFIVGSTEADPMKGKISDLSPIGGALIGAHVGDSVIANTPGGEVTLTILEISKS